MLDQVAGVGMFHQMDLKLLVRIIVHRLGHQLGEDAGLKEPAEGAAAHERLRHG